MRRPPRRGTLRRLRLSPAASTRREVAPGSGGSLCTVDSSGLCGSGKRSNVPANSLAWLGGADRDLLEQVPQERGRFAQMAGVLITTAGIAVMSMVFALHDAVTVPLLPSIVIGLLWGIVILNIDRFLVLSMGFTRDRWRLVWITLPRLALAVVLALVISTPLVLRIFASDINAQLFTMQAERSKQQAVLLAGTAQGQEAARLQSQISADQAVLAGHLPVAVTSPQLQTAQARVNNLQAQAQSDYKTEVDAYKAWQCQLDGQTCAGGSGKSGTDR